MMKKNFCGANDSNSFKAFLNTSNPHHVQNIPLLTYEGVFSEHYFKDQLSKPASELVDLDVYYAVTNNLFGKTNHQELWAACLFKSDKDGKEREIPIDVSVVLDISGSMSSPLTYGTEERVSKLKLAQAAIKKLLDKSLKKGDRYGLATFNDKGQVITPMTEVSNLDVEKEKETIDSLKSNGGTTVAAGMQVGINMFEQQEKQVENRQKRILFITDMMDMGAFVVDQQIAQAVEQEIFVSFIGVGVEFNNSLTDAISKHQGCNYFSITKNEEMEEIIVTEFSFNFFPCAYNVDLKMETTQYDIATVYGTTFSTTQQDQLQDNYKQFRAVTEINTMSPGAISDEGIKGGLILIKLDSKSGKLESGEINFDVSYTKTPKKNSEIFSKQISLKIGQIQADDKNLENFLYSSRAILKGIVLQKYVELCKKYSTLVQQKADQLLNVKEVDIEISSNEEELQQMCQNFAKDDCIFQVIRDFKKFKELILSRLQ